jgi:hypothetical protein
MNIVESEAAQAWKRIKTDLDELNSNGTEPPVYRAALTLPLTQGGITAVVGAITEYPSGFTFYLKNTAGAGEIFLICAIDGVWQVWQETDGFIPIVSPAVAGNLVELTAGGELVDAGFAVGATGQSLVTSNTVDGARGVLGLPFLASPVRQLEHAMISGWGATNTGSGATTIGSGTVFRPRTGATALSTSRYTLANSTPIGKTSLRGFRMTDRFVFSVSLSIVTANTEGIFRVFFGKATTEGFGLTGANNIGFTIANNQLTDFFGVYSSTRNDIAITPVAIATGTTLMTKIVMLYEDKNISLYVDDVLVGQNSGAGTAGNAFGSVNMEIQNGATAAQYSVDLISFSQAF